MTKKLLFIPILFLLGDLYFYQAIATLYKSSFASLLYWGLDLCVLLFILALVWMRKTGKTIQMWIPRALTAFLLLFVPKLFASSVLVAEDVTRLLRGFPDRNMAISEVSLFLAMIIFVIIIFGLTHGRHFYKIRRETLYFSDLPSAFDGFTITQLSDIHSGSLTNRTGVKKGIDLANAQRSDLLLFTGDLVNNMASEMDPWIEDFTKLTAPYGKYAVLGNHDYGDYTRWENPSAQAANLRQLKEMHRNMGFQLLLNQAVTIHKQGQQISLIGVENWGKGGFHQYGDLQKATKQVPDDAFKILMSHDPSHWDEVTLDHHQHIHLTLAGHTHGLQFGVELFGFKWSPIQYFYKQWAGLYMKSDKYLYVNRGFGYHGLKGRVGVWPEITVLTLRRQGLQVVPQPQVSMQANS
ncbi:metallophosphoesterase [Sphingobacterium suaedae]|uniref:Metallophosphoesterase n=1 Tax=Sphingobacterium suaedae TaxID=1686402 RepID=A0ABW5KG98_9SPHI